MELLAHSQRSDFALENNKKTTKRKTPELPELYTGELGELHPNYLKNRGATARAPAKLWRYGAGNYLKLLNDYSRIAYYTSGIKVSRKNYLLVWVGVFVFCAVVASLG